MIVINNKNNYRAILIVSFIAINILVLFGMSEILGYLNSGADRSSMLHLEKETSDTYLPKVTWETFKNQGRRMENQTIQKIEKHYLFSYVIKNNALKNNVNDGIDDYFTESSRKQLEQIIAYNKAKKISIQSTTIEHHASLDFYSEDGQQVVFTDKNVVEFQNIYQDNKLITSVRDTANYKVLMLLEDGFWRIRHYVRMQKERSLVAVELNKKIYTVKGNEILKNGVTYIIKGINYYPKNSAWDMFGNKFNRDTIATDFEFITKAKLNTIRIFVPYEEFGKAEVSKEKLDKLKIVLDLAEEKKLAVIVTLFDFYGDYAPESWTLTHRHAEKIVTTFKDSKNVIAWDIKNEPDLDFQSRGEQNVKPWLEEMIATVKKFDPNHLVTIGYSNIASGEILKDKVDFVSYHYYEDISLFEDKFAVLEKATKKPLVMQEFGLSSNRGLWSWFGNSKEDQADYHKKMQSIFKKKQLAFVSWTLYDFPKVPDKVAGKWPWIKNKQKQFGFIDSEGKNKPSFLYINY
ncbi:cellulase family glycosylhydrolase [Flavobacterium sp. Fl-318]|uniref:mannan endo-1,4-beta-mannosidase n=1 Tax=Flavobacterium cupriresistens TaxID=2893885 RepID=A0ABU4RJA7_9FLAO|nr:MULTISPECIES: cellulase family glycosylhydrolase [unclassified Flavobacterium]MDX6192003.1 cellulase family glycosylhydrolase [Flavobacterium sp. Fl-318]UFH44633.1 glycoside hydrolase family 5 protein [Flavobacterium sp. F-323]